MKALALLTVLLMLSAPFAYAEIDSDGILDIADGDCIGNASDFYDENEILSTDNTDTRALIDINQVVQNKETYGSIQIDGESMEGLRVELWDKDPPPSLNFFYPIKEDLLLKTLCNFISEIYSSSNFP